MMKQRCLNPQNDAYKDYGGRGIKVCDRWLLFENFVEDMGIPPAGATIGRIDNDGPYSPENCHWETYAQQNINYRKNRLVTYKGSTKPLSVWCEELGLDYFRTYQRLYRQEWTVVRAFEGGPETCPHCGGSL